MKLMKFYGWTSFWNTIYYLDEESFKNYRLYKHEMKHIEQMQKDGKFVFGVKYLYFISTVGYENNPYEIEARKAEEV